MQLNQQANEQILNSARTKIAGREKLICLLSTQQFLMVDLGSQAVERHPLPYMANLIKAFDAAPDMMFVACNVNQKGYLMVMTTTEKIEVPDEHPSLLTDILYFQRGENKIIFTACEQEIRVYTLTGN